MAERRCLHQLQILLVLRRRAADHFVHPLAYVLVAEPVELAEGREELIMPTEAGRGHIAPHRKRVHQPVVEVLLRRG